MTKPASVLTPLAEAVLEGLTGSGKKSLPSQFFYDAEGSALFEAITLLPEYGLTRADERILRTHAADIVTAAGRPTRILELGSGTGTKTRWVLEAAIRMGGRPSVYCPIDVSDAALAECEASLGGIAGLTIEPQHASYLDGLERAADRAHRTLVLFLGSTIGNFNATDAAEFLTLVRSHLSAHDSLLLGADLLQPVPKMVAAYDDSAGVTAAFNLNLLARINRELGGHFDLNAFAHEAHFNAADSRMEMQLRSRATQAVRIDALDLTVHFRAGEVIATELSHKFTVESIARLAGASGFRQVRQWIDAEWAFAETLLAPLARP